MIYRPQAEFEPRKSDTADRYITGLMLDGRKPSQTIEIAVDPATGIVAERLRVPEGTPVAVRKRVRSIDGEPFNINDTYYLLDKVKDSAIMSPTDVPQGSNTIARQLIGHEVHTLDEFYVRMPIPDEVRRLRLNPGTPVAVHYATGYTKDDEVIRVEYHVLPGDRHVIVYERDSDGVE
jgi:GntR family transcriptional regulator